MSAIRAIWTSACVVINFILTGSTILTNDPFTVIYLCLTVCSCEVWFTSAAVGIDTIYASSIVLTDNYFTFINICFTSVSSEPI